MKLKLNSISNIKGLGIRAKVIGLATVFSVLPVLIVGGIAYYVSDRSISQQINKVKIAEAEQLSSQLNSFLQDQLESVTTIGEVVQTVKSAHEHHDSEHDEKEHSEQEEQATIKQELEDILTSFNRNNIIYSHVGLYDLNGNEIVKSRSSKAENNKGEYAYFEQVVNSGLSAISEPIVTNFGGYDRYSIYLAAPVKNESGRMTGVVLGKIPVGFVADNIGSYNSRDGRGYYLVDSSGNIIYNIGGIEDIPIGTRIADTLDIFEELDKKRESQSWSQKISKVSQWENLYVYAPLNYAPQRKENYLQWSLVTSTEGRLAFAPQRQLLQTIALGTLTTALIAALIAALLANRAIKPLVKASKAVEKFGQGEFDLRIPTQGNDELAVLLKNINQMADRIQNLLTAQRQNTEQLVLHNEVLNTLSTNEGLIQGDAKAAATALTLATAQTLNIPRVSVWLHNSSREELTCLDLYEFQSQEHSEGLVFHATDFPIYFQSLEDERIIAADDAHTHRSTKEFSENYLTFLGISSMLHAPILVSGRVMGVLICEQTDKQRQWQASEINFVSSAANLMALAVESQLLQKEVENLLDTVCQVEQGDLTTKAQVSERTTGLVADTFNRLLEEISQVLASVLLTAKQVSVSATSLDRLALTVADGAQQQAFEVTEVTHLLSLVESAAQSSSTQVNIANQSLQKVKESVEQGQGTIMSMSQGINVLQQSTERMVQQMKALAEFVGLADQFVQDQRQIATSTQVLALNATLVAARASGQKDPRKFTEVAQEFQAIAQQVINLAQKTNDGLLSLQQRTDQINNVVLQVNGEVQSLNGLVSGFTQGVEQSNEVYSNVRQETEQVVEVGTAVAQSSVAILKAAQSTAQRMDDIAELASKTAELTKNTREQSENIEELSRRLLSRINFFSIPTELISIPDESPKEQEAPRVEQVLTA